MTTGIQTAVGRFVWHDLNSTNVEASKGFYTKLLGWDVEVWKPGEMDYQMISANGKMHGGFGDAQGGAPSHWLGHVVVDDVDAAGKRAQSAGGSLITGPMDIPEVGRILVIRDPQGAVISAYQPAGEMPMPEGVFGWDELITNDIDALVDAAIQAARTAPMPLMPDALGFNLANSYDPIVTSLVDGLVSTLDPTQAETKLKPY